MSEKMDNVIELEICCRESIELLQQLTTLTLPPITKENLINYSFHDTDEIYREKDDLVIKIGPNGTFMNFITYMSIDWRYVIPAISIVVKDVFDSKTLATHNLDGEPMKLNNDEKKERKKKLDSKKVFDIIYLVSTKCQVTERVAEDCFSLVLVNETRIYMERCKRPQENQDSEEDKSAADDVSGCSSS